MKKLGFGLMRLPLTDSEDETSIDMPQLCKMVDTFLERGFTYFDTAYMYHKYKSETAIREALVKRHPRDSFTLATKLPVMKLENKDHQVRVFEEQREKCGVDFFDFYLMHNLNRRDYDAVQEYNCFGFAEKLLNEGKIKHLGFSFHDTADMLDRILTDHPNVDFVQLQINYLDWENPKVQSRKCYETAIKHGKKVVIMEPVKGGVLAQLPKDAETLLKERDPDMSSASWAIRYAASLPNVMVVLSGMSSLSQLNDNTSYMSDFKKLTDEEMSFLRDKVAGAIRTSHHVPCTACRYCVDGCPMGIPIPNYMELYNIQYRGKYLRTGENAVNEYTALEDKGAKPSDCVQCRSCERSCPQHIEISEILKDVTALFDEARKQ